jgi:hypothetical protein
VIGERDLTGARDLAAVIDARLRYRLGALAPAAAGPWSAQVPPIADPERRAFAAEIAALMDARKDRIGEHAAQHTPAVGGHRPGPGPGPPAEPAGLAATVSVICRVAVIAILVRIVRSWRDWPCLIDLANRVARSTRCGQPPCAVVSSYRDGGIIRLACPELPALRSAAR